MFKIEKGVPIPKPVRTSKYPFAQMDIGDSFCVEDAKIAKNIISNAIRTSRDKKFSSRKEGDHYRIWRIA